MSKKLTNKIELLVAYDDNTWTTEVVDTPADIDRNDYNAVNDWVSKELMGLTQYRKVVLFSVYNTDPEVYYDAVCEKCGKCCDYDSDICLCKGCEIESGQTTKD